MSTTPNYRISGAGIRKLMRKHRITIRAISQKFSITMTRVREVREKGVQGFYADEWHFMITGRWLSGN